MPGVYRPDQQASSARLRLPRRTMMCFRLIRPKRTSLRAWGCRRHVWCGIGQAGKRTSLRAWGCPYAKGKRNCTGGLDAVGFPG